jgi:probable phosphoglycerate mutase
MPSARVRRQRVTPPDDESIHVAGREDPVNVLDSHRQRAISLPVIAHTTKDYDNLMAVQTSLINMDTKPRSFEIVFDGGSLGNPGKGYGSYEITSNGTTVDRQSEIQYGDGITNNQAEYLTLIHALRWLKHHLGNDAKTASVVVLGDSKLVLMQSQGKWKVNNEGLRPLNREVRDLLATFGQTTLTWHARKHSVARLGH